MGELKEAEEEPCFDILQKKNITGQAPNGTTWNLSDCWIEKIDNMNSEFIYIKEVGNHIEIGPANVNCIM